MERHYSQTVKRQRENFASIKREATITNNLSSIRLTPDFLYDILWAIKCQADII